ncbi:MAG: hypothetical protein ACYTEL_24685, partial [Planctomycetota bacterium]
MTGAVADLCKAALTTYPNINASIISKTMLILVAPSHDFFLLGSIGVFPVYAKFRTDNHFQL